MSTDTDRGFPVIVSGPEAFRREVLQAPLSVLVVFQSAWSAPCQALAPVLEAVAAACGNAAKVVVADADENPVLGMDYEIESVPTLLWFCDGRLCARIIGTASQEEILAAMPTSGMPNDRTLSGRNPHATQ